MVHLNNSWDAILAEAFASPEYQKIHNILKQEYAIQIIYPDMYHIFNALQTTDYNDVKVVILGQDPYHGAGQAHGLCFSVQVGVNPPPSLKNIYKELQSDVGFTPPKHGNLEAWAKQGVLLLNTTLTVRAGQAASHKNVGWGWFTDEIIKKLNERDAPTVFLLWGGHARSKAKLLNNPNHLVLETVHPSPLSAYNGWFGSKHFSQTNAFLEAHGVTAVDWTLPENLA